MAGPGRGNGRRGNDRDGQLTVRRSRGGSDAVPDHARRKLSAARMADRPQAPGGPLSASRARPRALEDTRGRPRRSPERRDAGRDQGARRRGARHHHRRRDPARKLLEPFCYRARWHRSGKSRHRVGPQRTPEPGAAGRGADPQAPSGGSFRPRIPAGPHQAPGQSHGAGPVHDGPAGSNRLLRRQPAAGCDGLRDCGQRGDPRPARRGRRHCSDR